MSHDLGWKFLAVRLEEWVRYLLHYANDSVLIGDVSMNNS